MRRRISPAPIFLIAFLLLGGGLTALRAAGLLQPLELAAYDLLMAARPPPMGPPGVSLVLIDEVDIQALGNWPLTDAQLVRALRQLLDLQPLAVGLDIYRDMAIAPGSDALQALLRDAPGLLAIERFPGPGARAIEAPAALRGSDRVGFADLAVDAGGVVRRNLLFQSGDQRTGYAFSLRLALKALAAAGIHPRPAKEDPALLRLGPTTLHPLQGDEGGYQGMDAGGYQILLRYGGGAQPFPSYTLRELLAGALSAAPLRDQVVILGVSASSVKDEFPVPHAIYPQARDKIPGAAVHAHAVQQLLDLAHGRGGLIRTWRPATETLWLWLWTGAGVLIGWLTGAAWRLAVVHLLGGALAVAVAVQAWGLGWWIPVVPNLLGWLLGSALGTAALAGLRRREQMALRGLFASQVSPAVAEEIWNHREEILEDGRIRPQTLTVTTLFADLQGFTAVSEDMDPEPFLHWLNTYLGRLTEVITAHGGTLDDYAGDGIKANFGVPLHDPDQVARDADRAVACALAMGVELNRLNRIWRARGHASIGMRIGIHTGRVVVGTVGSRARMKYTTVGRDVNLAARLEGLRRLPEPDPADERQSCRILVSAASAALIADRYTLQERGLFELKGIRDPVQVYCVTDPGARS